MAAITDSPAVCSLMLVRNSVDHDARVLRAARVAARALGGTALIVGVATVGASPGATMVEGVPVLRVPAQPPGLADLIRRLTRIGRRGSTIGRPHRPASAHTGSRVVLGHPVFDGAGGAERDGGPSRAAEHGRTTSPPRLTVLARARRILGGLSFSWQAIAVARRTRPRLVQANDWNTMWTGLAIKLGWGARLVYDSHELWADRNGRWERRRWLLASEAVFVRLADAVVTSSPGYADALAVRYRIRRPAVVRNIPEHHPQGGRASLTSPRAQLAFTSPPLPVRVVYVGGLMPGRGLEQMIDALALIDGVGLRTIGPGASQYRASLLARASAVGVADRVELLAAVAPGEVGGALTGAAVGLCLIQPICRSYELCLPNKLFEYAAAGVPVLASDVPVVAAAVRNGGLGEVVAAGDPHAIAAGLERLLQPTGWGRTAERALAFADANNWASEACGLRDVYGRAIGGLAT